MNFNNNIEDIELVVGFLEEQLEASDIKVVDSSVFGENENLAGNSQVAIITGHLPKKACILITHLIFKEGDELNQYRFGINGQIEKIKGKGRLPDLYLCGLNCRSDWFPMYDIKRTPHCGDHRKWTFRFDDYWESNSLDLKRGVHFYKEVIMRYKGFLEDKFTEEISLCYCQECLLKGLPWFKETSFITNIISKFPKELFKIEPRTSARTCKRRQPI